MYDTLHPSFETNHLQPLLHRRRSLQVLRRRRDVPLLVFLAQVDHVARKQRLAVVLEVSLVGVHEAIQPRQQLLGAVVGMQHDGDVVGGGNRSDVLCSGDTTGNGRLLLVIGNTLDVLLMGCPVYQFLSGSDLAGKVGGASLGQLQDDGGFFIPSGLKGGYGRRGGGDILSSVSIVVQIKRRIGVYNGGNGKVLLLGIVKELEDIIAHDDALLAAQHIGDTHSE